MVQNMAVWAVFGFEQGCLGRVCFYKDEVRAVLGPQAEVRPMTSLGCFHLAPLDLALLYLPGFAIGAAVFPNWLSLAQMRRYLEVNSYSSTTY